MKDEKWPHEQREMAVNVPHPMEHLGWAGVVLVLKGIVMHDFLFLKGWIICCKKSRGVGLLGCLIGFVYRDPNQTMKKSSTSTVTVRRGITQIHLYGCFQK